MSEEEKAMENQAIELKINEFADELEAKYLKEYSDRLENGETGIDKTAVSKIQYYEKFVFKMKNSMEMSIKGIYVVDSENNGEHTIEIYKEEIDEETGITTRELMATVNEKGEVVFTPEYATLQQAVANKNLEEILADNEENEKAELTQETIDVIEMEVSTGEMKKGDVSKEEAEQLEAESSSKEELAAKLKLQIRPGTAQELAQAEIREFPEFRGRNVEFGYSRTEQGYVAYDKDTGDILMGPAIANTRTITKQSAEGEITTERHSAMMQSSRNPNKMVTIQIGAYGERILNEADRTSEGDIVARAIDVRGKTQNNKELREKFNDKENRENFGETADDLEQLGVTKKGTKKYFSEAELDEFMEKIQIVMGPCSRDELIDRFQKAEGETLAEKLEDAKATYRREQIQYTQRIKNGEGRGIGEGAEDPRRAI